MIKKYIYEICKKIALGKRYDSKSYIKFLKSKGCRIGERTDISPRQSNIDLTRPWLIKIGNDVQITEGVMILSHGYDWSVLKGVYGTICGSSGLVEIGNNVFIGAKTTILKSTHIGDNVIIGAGSLVTGGVYESNAVYAGNPAKKICTLDEYFKKRSDVNLQLKEARELVLEYYEVYKVYPPEETMHEFFWLFSNNYDSLCYKFKDMMKLIGNESKSKEVFMQNTPVFETYEDFLKWCINSHGEEIY